MKIVGSLLKIVYFILNYYSNSNQYIKKSISPIITLLSELIMSNHDFQNILLDIYSSQHSKRIENKNDFIRLMILIIIDSTLNIINNDSNLSNTHIGNFTDSEMFEEIVFSSVFTFFKITKQGQGHNNTKQIESIISQSNDNNENCSNNCHCSSATYEDILNFQFELNYNCKDLLFQIIIKLVNEPSLQIKLFNEDVSYLIAYFTMEMLYKDVISLKIKDSLEVNNKNKDCDFILKNKRQFPNIIPGEYVGNTLKLIKMLFKKGKFDVFPLLLDVIYYYNVHSDKAYITVLNNDYIKIINEYNSSETEEMSFFQVSFLDEVLNKANYYIIFNNGLKNIDYSIHNSLVHDFNQLFSEILGIEECYYMIISKFNSKSILNYIKFGLKFESNQIILSTMYVLFNFLIFENINFYIELLNDEEVLFKYLLYQLQSSSSFDIKKIIYQIIYIINSNLIRMYDSIYLNYQKNNLINKKAYDIDNLDSNFFSIFIKKSFLLEKNHNLWRYIIMIIFDLVHFYNNKFNSNHQERLALWLIDFYDFIAEMKELIDDTSSVDDVVLNNDNNHCRFDGYETVFNKCVFVLEFLNRKQYKKD